MNTIPARQHAADLALLERVRLDFDTRGRRAHRRGDHIQADDCFDNARMFARIISVYRTAGKRKGADDDIVRTIQR